MSKKKKKKKSIFKKRFYRIYFVCTFVLLIAIVVGMGLLKGVLKDYEAAQPVYVAQQIATLFENRDFETLYTLDSNRNNIGDGDKEFYLEKLHELTDGKALSWDAAFSANEDEKIYSVTCEGDRLAQFTLVPSGAVDARGNRLWTLSSIKTNVMAEKYVEPVATPEPTPEPVVVDTRETFFITVPSGYSVTAEGEVLGESALVQANVPLVSEGLLPEDVPQPTTNMYAFKSANESPELIVTDENGQNCTPVLSSERNYVCDYPENPELATDCEEGVVLAAKRLAGYSTKDNSQKSMLALCATGSPARDSVKDFDNTWCSRHKSAEFENMQVTQYRKYSDDCFSCHVSFDYKVYFKKDDSKVYPTEYTFYFIKEKGKFKLYSFTLY